MDNDELKTLYDLLGKIHRGVSHVRKSVPITSDVHADVDRLARMTDEALTMLLKHAEIDWWL